MKQNAHPSLRQSFFHLGSMADWATSCGPFCFCFLPLPLPAACCLLLFLLLLGCGNEESSDEGWFLRPCLRSRVIPCVRERPFVYVNGLAYHGHGHDHSGTCDYLFSCFCNIFRIFFCWFLMIFIWLSIVIVNVTINILAGWRSFLGLSRFVHESCAIFELGSITNATHGSEKASWSLSGSEIEKQKFITSPLTPECHSSVSLDVREWYIIYNVCFY